MGMDALWLKKARQNSPIRSNLDLKETMVGLSGMSRPNEDCECVQARTLYLFVCGKEHRKDVVEGGDDNEERGVQAGQQPRQFPGVGSCEHREQLHTFFQS